MNDLPFDLDSLLDLTRRAGVETLKWWRSDLDVTDKADASPVTAADIAAHKLIVRGLQQLTPDIPVLSEEDAEMPFAQRQHWQRFWLVDPLDGTKEFIAGTDEFTVNIALSSTARCALAWSGCPPATACSGAARGWAPGAAWASRPRSQFNVGLRAAP